MEHLRLPRAPLFDGPREVLTAAAALVTTGKMPEPLSGCALQEWHPGYLSQGQVHVDLHGNIEHVCHHD